MAAVTRATSAAGVRPARGGGLAPRRAACEPGFRRRGGPSPSRAAGCRAAAAGAVPAPTSDERPGGGIVAGLKQNVGMALGPRCYVALPQGGGPDGEAAGEGPLSHVVWTFLGAFVAFLTLGYVDTLVAPSGLPFMIGSWGPISVLLFCTDTRTNAVLRIWNTVLGHAVAAVIVIVTMKLIGTTCVARALAFATTTAAMLVLGCVHPPGGALVLIAMDSAKFQSLQWWYILYPALTGVVWLYFLATCVNWLKDNVVLEAHDVLPFTKPKAA